MTAPATATDFLQLVRKSGVLDEKKFAEVFPHDDLPADPARCAAALVRAGLLTPFQAQSLLAGKFRGFVLGPYRVLQPLGQGGMGSVFLADHAALNRKVAIKVLHKTRAGDELAVERFHREARAAAALDHPNIVRLFDISQGAGVHFLVMEYVEGTTLQELMAKTGPLHYAQAAAYVAQAAAGLHHAHSRGLVHRDIKPANLMLAKGGVVKILDMGLARSLADEKDNLTERLGEESEVAGTADFIAPEQALNQSVDARADLYSLGATFYTLLTGHPPFSGSTAQKLMQHQLREPPKLNKLRAVVPPALVDVIEKMMGKRPEDRYQTAEDVIDALGPWLPAATTGSMTLGPVTLADPVGSRARLAATKPRTTPGKDGRRPWWKRPGVLAAAGGGILALGLVVFFATRGGDDPLPAPPGDTAQAPPAPEKALPRPAPNVKPPTPTPTPAPAPLAAPKREFVKLPLRAAATARSDEIFVPLDADLPNKNSVAFLDYEPKEFNGVPFELIDPSDGTSNAIALFSTNQPRTSALPESVSLPVGGPVGTIHVLGGISGWGWPCTKGRTGIGAPKDTPSVVVRIRYADGKEEGHVWKNGEHLADYNGRRDVPGSEYAFTLKHNNQCRYLAVRPRRAAAVRAIEFAKADEDRLTCPLVLAVTIEKPAGAAP
jgi:tRNA A-37 threonylcarbamoyl transferase component Bud32